VIDDLHADPARAGGLGALVQGDQRAKNFWTLGLLYYLYNRPLEITLKFIADKFTDEGTSPRPTASC
jgi:hypothetical protein